MIIPIPESLLPALRAARDRQVAAGRPHQWPMEHGTFLTPDAVLLQAAMGFATFLTFDGRVVVFNGAWETDEPVYEMKHLNDIVGTIVRWSGVEDLDFLLDFLPARPEGKAACGFCSGGRYWPGTTQGAEGHRSSCPKCLGLGWEFDRPRRAS